MKNIPAAAQAAVLLIERSEGASDWQLLLTQRTAHLNSHAGEVAFPGGMKDETDVHLQATALRETAEEVGLQPHQLTVTGRLPRAFTRKGVEVHPYMARLQAPAALTINERSSLLGAGLLL